MVKAISVLDNIVRANFHRGGWRTLRLFDLEPSLFGSMVSDVERMIVNDLPSEVQSKQHVTNWTEPLGRAVQFSLLNASGDFADTSGDHDLRVSGKKFHHAKRYPALDEFINLLPGATSMRLNGMSPRGGLSPHEEHVIRRQGRRYYVRARFHLPIATNADALVLLDDQWFHLQPGVLYFFNNGCVHSAMNGGSTQRYHLVWDMTLTREVVEYMFGDEAQGPMVRSRDRRVPLHHEERVAKYAISGPSEKLYRLSRAEKLGVQAHQWQHAYNRAAYATYRAVGRLEFDELR